MRPTEPNKTPLARSEGLLIQSVRDETIAYDLETKEAHCLRPVAAFVFERCNGATSVANIAAASKNGFSRAITADEVADAVSQLEQIQLLEVPPLVVVDGDSGVSRRDMMRRIGYAGAAATVGTGLVMSITAPTALAACTGQQGGCSCTQNKDCASNHCCQAVSDKCNAGCCTTTNNGTECKCNADGTCNSPGNPTSCCMGICTPTTTCTTGSTLKQSGTSRGTLSPQGGGGGGGITTTSTPTAPTPPTTPATTTGGAASGGGAAVGGKAAGGLK